MGDYTRVQRSRKDETNTNLQYCSAWPSFACVQRQPLFLRASLSRWPRLWGFGLVLSEKKAKELMGKGHNPRWAGPQGHCLQECLPLDSRGGSAPGTAWRKTKTAPKSPISNVEKSHSGSAYEKIVIIEFGFYNNITTAGGKEEKEEVLEGCMDSDCSSPALTSLGSHPDHPTTSPLVWSSPGQGQSGLRDFPNTFLCEIFPPSLPCLSTLSTQVLLRLQSARTANSCSLLLLKINQQSQHLQAPVSCRNCENQWEFFLLFSFSVL